MTQTTTGASRLSLLACEEGCDPIEERLRAIIRTTMEAVFEEELESFLSRMKYGRTEEPVKGYRHGRRQRQVTSTMGTTTVSVSRARLQDGEGNSSQWRSKPLGRYQRWTQRAEALIASMYLAGATHGR